MDIREKLNQLDNKTLYANLLLTQFILGVIGGALYFIFLRHQVKIEELYHIHSFLDHLFIGIVFAVGVILIDLAFMSIFPKKFFDDGGVNERIFRDINALQIALIALVVALVEEWLFRGVLQNIIGLFWTSLLFAGIHYRYLQKWLYALVIILTSFGFGWLYAYTGSLWSVISAHFFIDFGLGLMIRYKVLSFKY